MNFAGRLFERPKFCPDHSRWLDTPKLSIGNNLQISESIGTESDLSPPERDAEPRKARSATQSNRSINQSLALL
jgi:hypothetical protein